ncbi:MAG: VOC family protein [Kibdelosporangium sp.]
MLRGLSTVSFFTDDMPAARAWYTELLGVEPYFERDVAGTPAYMEFRIGDYQHELGFINTAFAPHKPAEQASGAVIFWHVDDVPATLENLETMGATIHDKLTEREAGFVTASVLDPFGNILGVMYNPHYLDVLGKR